MCKYLKNIFIDKKRGTTIRHGCDWGTKMHYYILCDNKKKISYTID